MKVNTHMKASSIKHTLVSVIAVSLIAIPMLASAGSAASSTKKASIFYDSKSLDNPTDQEILYARIKDAARDMCGTDNLHVTGSVERSRSNDECYEGTLTAAVNRLDDPRVSALHEK